MSVPLFATSLEPYRERIADRLTSVAASGRFILGPEAEAFEAEFAACLGVEHVVGVGDSGARGCDRTPIHRQPAMAAYAERGAELPAAEELAATTLALPMGSELHEDQIEAVVAACGARAGQL